MYQYNLIISIFSKDKELEKIIHDVKPQDKFSHSIKTYEKIDNDIISSSDIIICDLPIELIDFKKSKKNAKIIICCEQFDEKYEKMDGIFIKPFNYKYIKYSFQKIIEKIKNEEELYYCKTCLNTAIDSIPDMFWIKSIDGIHTLVNKEFCTIVGKDREDVTGKDHYYIWNVSKDDPNSGADICKKTEDDVIAAGHTLRFTEYVKSQNKMRQLVTYKSPIYDRNGLVIGTVGFGHDVTDSKKMNVENEILLNSVPYAVLIRDNDGKVQNINRHFETYFGISKDEIIGSLYDDWAQKTFTPNRNFNKEGYIEGSTIRINGKIKKVELRLNNICDIFGNITGQIYIFRDVTIERKLQSQLLENSNVDFMTNLKNRRYLDKFILEQPKGITLSLFSIDLDHFKSVNDTYGHKAGDEAIILAAKTLKDCFKNDLVVRMGGDEFLVVKVGEYEIAKLEEEAQNTLDALTKNFNKTKEFKLLTASIGISKDILQSNNIDKILKQSDVALYEAKEEGRACYRIYQKKNK